MVVVFSPFLQKLSVDVSLAVQECLSLMAAAYRGVQGQSALIIEALLLENIYSVWHKVAHVYIYYLSSSFFLSLPPSSLRLTLKCG